jgi:hypothetical protein
MDVPARSMSNLTPHHYEYALQTFNSLNTNNACVERYRAPGNSKLTFDMSATATPTGGATNLILHAHSNASLANSEHCTWPSSPEAQSVTSSQNNH